MATQVMAMQSSRRGRPRKWNAAPNPTQLVPGSCAQCFSASNISCTSVGICQYLSAASPEDQRLAQNYPKPRPLRATFLPGRRCVDVLVSFKHTRGATCLCFRSYPEIADTCPILPQAAFTGASHHGTWLAAHRLRDLCLKRAAGFNKFFKVSETNMVERACEALARTFLHVTKPRTCDII